MFLATVVLALTCSIPSGIHITAPDTCFTMHKIEQEWPELEGRVHLVRSTLQLPYEPMPLSEVNLDVVEHGDEFHTTDGDEVYGVYSPAGGPNAVDGQMAVRPRVDFARLYEREYRVLLHEMGHYRYNVEQNRTGEKGEGGWFMHGTLQDAALQAVNVLIAYLWPFPQAHPYFPGLLGQPHQDQFVSDGRRCMLRKERAS